MKMVTISEEEEKSLKNTLPWIHTLKQRESLEVKKIHSFYHKCKKRNSKMNSSEPKEKLK